MQNKEYVYFLTVKEAKKIAEKHEGEDDWDIWHDPVAQVQGWLNYLKQRIRNENRRAS